MHEAKDRRAWKINADKSISSLLSSTVTRVDTVDTRKSDACYDRVCSSFRAKWFLNNWAL